LCSGPVKMQRLAILWKDGQAAIYFAATASFCILIVDWIASKIAPPQLFPVEAGPRHFAHYAYLASSSFGGERADDNQNDAAYIYELR
jgi:hypothetical protein